MKNYFFIFSLVLCSLLNAQQTINEVDLKVYVPTVDSKKLNDAYAENLFFGLFGVKALMNAVPNNLKNVRELTISSASFTGKKKKVFIAKYSATGQLSSFELMEELGSPLKVEYIYKEGVIQAETITNKEKQQKKNTFYYQADKMYVKNANQLFDMIWLEGEVMMKKTYLDQKLGFEDRLMHNCRITKSMGQDINKVCFSSTDAALPLKIKEYTPDVNLKTQKVTLLEGGSSEVIAETDKKYTIIKQGVKQFDILVNKDKRIEQFNFLGNPAEKQNPLAFEFTYSFY